MSQFIRRAGLLLALLSCGRCLAAADTAELPTPEELASATAEKPPELLRPLFARLIRVASLGAEYQPVLRKTLASADSKLRLFSAIGLSATGQHDEAVMKPILESLAAPRRSYPNEEDMLIAQGLAAQGATAIPLWRAALQHDSPIVRADALTALARIGPAAKAALPDVLRFIRSPTGGRTSLAIFAKWRLDGDDQYASEELGLLLREKRERQCAGAVDYLAQMGPAARGALPALIAALKEHRDPAVVDALDALFPHFAARIQPVLKSALDDPKLAFRAAAALQYREGNREYLLPHLVRMMNAEGDQVIERHELARILGTYGPQAAAAIPGLTRELRRSLSGQTRINAAQALGEMGSAAREALPALRAALEDAEVAAAADQAITRIESGCVESSNSDMTTASVQRSFEFNSAIPCFKANS